MSGMMVKSRVVTMTPAWAATLLSKNTRNRIVSNNTVESYARDMKAGKWAVNTTGIGLMADGTLADGQHRLLACIKANVSFKTLLLEGVSEEGLMTTDTGRKRTAGDVFQMKDIKNARNVAATLRYMYSMASNDYTGRISTSELYDLYLLHPDVAESVNMCNSIRIVPSNMVAAIHYIAATHYGEPAKADAFVQVFVSGVPAYAGCPAHLFRERMIRIQTSGGTMLGKNKIHGLAHSWNYFRRTKPIGKFYIPETLELKGWDMASLKKTKPVIAALSASAAPVAATAAVAA